MAFSDAHLAEFQSLYQEHFGIHISKEQALEKALRLLRLVEVVSRAVAKEEAANLYQHNLTSV